MKTWKIKNISDEPIKISVITSSTTSRGLILKPNEVCLSLPQNTAALDAQIRRGFVSVDMNYNNNGFELAVPIDEETFKLEEAKKNAVNYMNK